MVGLLYFKCVVDFRSYSINANSVALNECPNQNLAACRRCVLVCAECSVPERNKTVLLFIYSL